MNVAANKHSLARRLTVFAGLTLFLASCRENDTARPQTSAATAASTTDTTTFVGIAVADLSALHEGTTPAQWQSERGGYLLTPFFVDADINHDSNHWCVRASRTDSLADGSRVMRYAYFYPPPVPASLELPVESDSASIVSHTCTLGAVWVESPSDSAGGRVLAERTREELIHSYGSITAAPDSFMGRSLTDSQKQRMRARPGYETMQLGLSFFGSAYWHVPGRWQRGPATIVSAFDADFHSSHKPRVVAFGFLPNAQFGITRFARDEGDSGVAEADTALETAGKLTRLDANVVRDFLALEHDQDSSSRKVAAIGAWLAATKNLSAERRAAALFAADGVVPDRLDGEDSHGSEAYGNVGVKFVHSDLAGSYNYTHELLEEALRLDPKGPIGVLATMEMLDRGFDLTGMCGGGFEDVIKTGVPFLDRLASPRSRAHLMFQLGDAHADIVALAAGEGGDYVDTADFKAHAPSARRKAIAYYRQGLALNPSSPEARAAWLEAWRLLAGMPPSRTHFFCVYD
jgi:tetratricopeptide (TPR) repeat protein